MSGWDFASEGKVAVEGGSIWYGICGDLNARKPPLLAIHGGPGMSHHYLRPLCDLADERAVVFYDQLDAGYSDRPNVPENWRIERFLSEIDALRTALGLTRLNIFGNSWGGTLTAAYAAKQPSGLERVILSSPLIKTSTWIADNAAYRAALPADLIATLDACEAQGREADPEYNDAVDQFYRRHLCRANPWPDYVERTFAVMNEACYTAMWGPNEFTCSGVLKDYDGSPGLSRIAVPTLVTCGAYDEATPDSTGAFAAKILNAEFEIFDRASHMAFIEQRADYFDTLRRFLS